MTDANSFSSVDTIAPPRERPAADSPADRSSGATPSADDANPALARQSSPRPYPLTPDGRPLIVVRPLPPELPTDPPDEAAPSGAGPAEHSRIQQPAIEDRGTKSAGPSVPKDVDPIDQLVESVFPTSFTDWLLADPLSRWELFEQAIAKDRAGVDAAFDRARAVGYRVSRFTDALKAVVGIGAANAAITHTAATTESGGRAVEPVDGGAVARLRTSPPREPRLSPIPPLGNWPSAKPPESPGSIARPPASADLESDDDDDIAIFAKFADDADAGDREGRIRSDEDGDPALAPGQRYAQRVTQRNLAITGHRGTDELTEMFLSVLGRTAKKMGAGSGSKFGIAVHKDFEEEIGKLQLPGVRVEHSYDRSSKTAVKYGREGTIRTDVIKLTTGGKTVAVWDLKTGRAVLRPSRARELAEATGVPLNRVIEINYVSWKALRRGW